MKTIYRNSFKQSWLIALLVAAPAIFAEDSHPVDPPTPPPVATPEDPHTSIDTHVNAKFEVVTPDPTVSKSSSSMQKIDADLNPPLSLAGQPGDVRLVVSTTSVIARKRNVVPKIPLPPFNQWNKWLDEHKDSTHCSLDWMDSAGQWWHTEVNDISDAKPDYIVGKGEFPATGITVYAVLIIPGRTNPEDQKVMADEKINCDYRVLEAEARKYGTKNKEHGDHGTNGNGKENVGLGGPAYKPSQNSNTYVNYLLKKAGVNHAAPKGAVGWDTEPHFPISTDATE